MSDTQTRNADLISRSALLEAIDAEFFKTAPLGEEQLGFLKCRRFAREAPSVDAEPVRHGRWIPAELRKSFGILNGVKCSLCGKEMVVKDNNYCPNCGAKMMDGDVDA